MSAACTSHCQAPQTGSSSGVRWSVLMNQLSAVSHQENLRLLRGGETFGLIIVSPMEGGDYGTEGGVLADGKIRIELCFSPCVKRRCISLMANLAGALSESPESQSQKTFCGGKTRY